MPTINNRQQFIDYCLRRLGAPVIDINMDDDQIEDRVDDAIQYWQDYHFDGTQKFYWIHTVTQQDINITKIGRIVFIFFKKIFKKLNSLSTLFL